MTVIIDGVVGVCIDDFNTASPSAFITCMMYQPCKPESYGQIKHYRRLLLEWVEFQLFDLWASQEEVVPSLMNSPVFIGEVVSLTFPCK